MDRSRPTGMCGDTCLVYGSCGTLVRRCWVAATGGATAARGRLATSILGYQLIRNPQRLVPLAAIERVVAAIHSLVLHDPSMDIVPEARNGMDPARRRSTGRIYRQPK